MSSDILSLFSKLGLGHLLSVWDHEWIVCRHGRRRHGTYTMASCTEVDREIGYCSLWRSWALC